MMRPGERGILLLPVALTLAVIGALAYTMTREGSMNVSAVDAQYEIETARYLAASGVQVAKWRTAKDKCVNRGDAANFVALTLRGGKVDATVEKWDKGVLTVSARATPVATGGQRSGAVHTLTRKMQVHNLGDPKIKILIGGGADDITIVKNSSNPPDAKSLTATDDTSLPLVYFELPTEMDNALISQANLKLTKEGLNATPANRSLGIHRITTNWTSSSVTWTTPWTVPGGDYVAQAAASSLIDENPPPRNEYVFPIHSLVQSWADDRRQNNGMLLKPTRLVNASFTSFDGASKPELDVHYYLPCK